MVCDNLRSGVTRPHRYEPDVNATYSEMAAHYGVAIIPARSYRPRDKACATDCSLYVRSETKLFLPQIVARWDVCRHATGPL